MKIYITFLERTILESLSQGEKSFIDLCQDLNYTESVLTPLINSLVEKKLIQLTETSLFSINKEMTTEMIEGLQDIDLKSAELSLIVRSTIKKSLMTHDMGFKLKKLSIGKKDFHILMAKLYEIELFIKEAEKKQIETSKKKIFFWGINTYENIYHDIINTY